MDKKEYSAKEAAVSLLDRVKAKALEHMKKSEKKTESTEERLEKAAPQNQTAAQAAGIEVPQPSAPKANEKMIAKPKEMKLKKFMDKMSLKRAEKSKHDRCVEQVKEKSPDVDSPHAVCVAAGVRPEKWRE